MDLNINAWDIITAIFGIFKTLAASAPWYAWLLLLLVFGAGLVEKQMKKKRR